MICAPKFDVPVTEQLTHACKVPETLHQVTLNVCRTFSNDAFEYRVINVNQYIF